MSYTKSDMAELVEDMGLELVSCPYWAYELAERILREGWRKK
jgi:hypothetical protein